MQSFLMCLMSEAFYRNGLSINRKIRLYSLNKFNIFCSIRFIICHLFYVFKVILMEAAFINMK